jgi:hypothetical protein
VHVLRHGLDWLQAHVLEHSPPPPQSKVCGKSCWRAALTSRHDDEEGATLFKETRSMQDEELAKNEREGGCSGRDLQSPSQSRPQRPLVRRKFIH